MVHPQPPPPPPPPHHHSTITPSSPITPIPHPTTITTTTAEQGLPWAPTDFDIRLSVCLSGCLHSCASVVPSSTTLVLNSFRISYIGLPFVGVIHSSPKQTTIQNLPGLDLKDDITALSLNGNRIFGGIIRYQ